MIKVLKRLVEKGLKEKGIQIWASEREITMHLIDTMLSVMLEGRISHELFQMFVDLVFWNEISTDLSRSYV